MEFGKGLSSGGHEAGAPSGGDAPKALRRAAGAMNALGPKRRALLLTATVIVAATAVYANSLGNEFAYDDRWIVETRTEIQDLGRIEEIVTTEYWPSKYNSGLYRPVTLLSFALDWALWDGDPFGFHLVNLLLHAAVSVLVLLLLLEFFPWWAAWAGGMVFAVHSVHTEAVANVVGRGELLTAAFAILAAVVYVRAMREDRLTPVRAGIVLSCYALACLSKELGFVLPGLLLATDLPLLRRRLDWRRFVMRRAPLFAGLTAVLVAIMLVRRVVLGAAVRHVPDHAFIVDSSFSSRLFTMARVWLRYFELSFFPLDLSVDYSPAVILPVDHLTLSGALGFLLVAGILILAIATFRRCPHLSMAVAWFAIAILPVSNLLVVVEIVLAERTLYLPSVAVSMLAAIALVQAGAARRLWIAAGIALWVLFFSVVTVQRNYVWKNTDTVFEDLRKKHPESSRLLWALSGQLYNRGDMEGTEMWLRRALEIWPYNAELQFDFARFLAEQGRFAEAEAHIALARAMKPWAPGNHQLLIIIRLRRNDLEGAIRAADAALEAAGPNAALYALQAEALESAGRLQEAVASTEEAVRLRPDRWRYWFRLAGLRHSMGDSVAAIIALDGAERAGAAAPARTDSLRRAWMPPSH